MIDDDDECVHGMNPTFCAMCQTDPDLPERVVITQRGNVFHRSAECKGLLEGWKKVVRYGGTPSDARNVHITHAQALGLAACAVRFADYYETRDGASDDR